MRRFVQRLTKNTEFMKIFVAGVKAIFFRGAGAVFVFILTLLVTNNLGASDSGIFFLFQTALIILSTFSRMGLENIVVRLNSPSWRKGDTFFVREVTKKAFLIVVSVSVILSLSVFLVDTVFTIS
ncbi:MAG: hypothetical protein HUJ29_00555, partial [Gammaproteobacteria bacterium]|nr:hypothetical protein [Gammaproteobacteria bacterium]